MIKVYVFFVLAIFCCLVFFGLSGVTLTNFGLLFRALHEPGTWLFFALFFAFIGALCWFVGAMGDSQTG